MTYASLRASLKALCPNTYRWAAPHGLTRYIMLHRYGANAIRGDDTRLHSFPRVQIDIYTQDEEDALPDQVCDMLTAAGMDYELTDEIYDEDLALFRTILQLEVYA